jgi:hypothetical protein
MSKEKSRSCLNLTGTPYLAVSYVFVELHLVFRHASGDVACCFSLTSSVKKNRLLVVDKVVGADFMMRSCLNFTGNLLSCASGRRRPPTFWLHLGATVGTRSAD